MGIFNWAQSVIDRANNLRIAAPALLLLATIPSLAGCGNKATNNTAVSSSATAGPQVASGSSEPAGDRATVRTPVPLSTDSSTQNHDASSSTVMSSGALPSQRDASVPSQIGGASSGDQTTTTEANDVGSANAAGSAASNEIDATASDVAHQSSGKLVADEVQASRASALQQQGKNAADTSLNAPAVIPGNAHQAIALLDMRIFLPFELNQMSEHTELLLDYTCDSDTQAAMDYHLETLLKNGWKLLENAGSFSSGN